MDLRSAGKEAFEQGKFFETAVDLFSAAISKTKTEPSEESSSIVDTRDSVALLQLIGNRSAAR
jgi:hypothetical protein